MLINWKKYTWPNPKTGDEFLYFFFENKNKKGTLFLNIKPAKHPLKQHPLGYFALISLPFWLCSIFIFKGKEIATIIDFSWKILFMISFITGSFFSSISYLFYYPKEKKWKQTVIKDWRENKLRYNTQNSILKDTDAKDESTFNETRFY